MKSNKVETHSGIDPLNRKKQEINASSLEEDEGSQQKCAKKFGFQTISLKLQCRTFVLYSIISIGIFISRMFYIGTASTKLDEYGQNYEIQYRLNDFQTTTNMFFENFELQFGQSRHALDVINDIYNVAESRYANYDFTQFSRCYMGNVTLCISDKKDQEITYKLRTDSFYQVYYLHTSSIYVTSSSDDSTVTTSQYNVVSKTALFENFYFNIFSHFYFTDNLHHKMFIVFPNDGIARIFPVEYISSAVYTTNDYLLMKGILQGTTTNQCWLTTQQSTYSYFLGFNDPVQTTQQILRISRIIKRNSDNTNVGVVSIDIFNSHLNTTFSNLLNSNYQTYFIDTQGEIIQTNIEDFTGLNIFTTLEGCYCELILSKFKSLGVSQQTQVQCSQPRVPYSADACKYFNMKELWLADGQYMFFLVTISNDSFSSSNSNKLIFTIAYVYFCLFLCLFFAIIYITRETIQEYTNDITNPIKQVSFKIQRIMHNIFNPKQFSKIRTDEIVIRERTEIRKLANKFSKTFQKLNEKNLFQTTIVSSIDKSYQKSKEISDKPQKDTIVDEVRNIVQSFLDDQQYAYNEQAQQQERNKYARSNKSRNNLDASML